MAGFARAPRSTLVLELSKSPAPESRGETQTFLKGTKMKKLLKTLGLVAVFTAIPVAFTGGSSDGNLGVGLNRLCAKDGPCAFAIGSICRNGDDEIFNHRRMAGAPN